MFPMCALTIYLKTSVNEVKGGSAVDVKYVALLGFRELQWSSRRLETEPKNALGGGLFHCAVTKGIQFCLHKLTKVKTIPLSAEPNPPRHSGVPSRSLHKRSQLHSFNYSTICEH